jgi:hypothetical protein
MLFVPTAVDRCFRQCRIQVPLDSAGVGRT